MKIKKDYHIYLITSKVALDPEKLRLLGQGKACIRVNSPHKKKGKTEEVK